MPTNHARFMALVFQFFALELTMPDSKEEALEPFPATKTPRRTIDAAPQGLRELHLMIEIREANHISTAATAVAIEEVFVGIHQEAGFVIFMQRAKPHPIGHDCGRAGSQSCACR
jgi:hypothetical protein